MYNVPTVTRRYIGSNNSDIRDSLRNGSYDFKHDPNYVIIGWNLWDHGSTKAELEKMLNEQISDTVYSKLKEYSSSGIIYRAGGSVSIVYGKGADGELRGKYAGNTRESSDIIRSQMEPSIILSERIPQTHRFTGRVFRALHRIKQEPSENGSGRDQKERTEGGGGGERPPGLSL